MKINSTDTATFCFQQLLDATQTKPNLITIIVATEAENQMQQNKQIYISKYDKNQHSRSTQQDC
jgi:hypothetical protein